MDIQVIQNVNLFLLRMTYSYLGQLASGIYHGLLIDQPFPNQFDSLLEHSRATEQVAVMEAIFRDVQKKYFSEEISMATDSTSNQTIDGVAALCSHIIGNRPYLESQVADWLSKGQGGSIQTVGLRRALVVNFANKNGEQWIGYHFHTA